MLDARPDVKERVSLSIHQYSYRNRFAMLKETGETITAVSDFLGKPKIVATLFLGSAAWLLPAVQRQLPVHGALSEYANLTASVLCIVTLAWLVVSALARIYEKAKQWIRSPQRVLRKALAGAKPVEKIVLEAVIQIGEHTVGLDAGSSLAMHLQQIGLIHRATGHPSTVYQITEGLADLCIKNPSLLQVSAEQEAAAVAELEQLQKTGQHWRLFQQLSGPDRFSWMG